MLLGSEATDSCYCFLASCSCSNLCLYILSFELNSFSPPDALTYEKSRLSEFLAPCLAISSSFRAKPRVYIPSSGSSPTLYVDLNTLEVITELSFAVSIPKSMAGCGVDDEPLIKAEALLSGGTEF